MPDDTEAPALPPPPAAASSSSPPADIAASPIAPPALICLNCNRIGAPGPDGGTGCNCTGCDQPMISAIDTVASGAGLASLAGAANANLPACLLSSAALAELAVQPPAPAFNLGDVVMQSAGPPMTVLAVRPGLGFECVWFDNTSNALSNIFAASELRLATFADGYKWGHAWGRREGVEAGHVQGKAAGRDEGFTAGYTDGCAAGQAAGALDGRDAGFQDGHASGVVAAIAVLDEYDVKLRDVGELKLADLRQAKSRILKLV